MYKSHKLLPPLSQLPAFEASARLLSFTRAAAELHLSQAAISQQIRQLEDNLGTKLFERMPRQIKLTEQGQKFQHTVAVTLELLENSAKELRSQNQNSGLTIAADISMAYMWLLPHFPQFSEAFPDIDVSVFASDRESECLKEGIDLALLYGNGNWEGFTSHLLIHEEVFPVCSPDYFAENTPCYFDARLSNHVLLDLKAERWDWIDWHQFLSKNQILLNQKNTNL